MPLVEANAADAIDLCIDATVMVAEKANTRTRAAHRLGESRGIADVALFARATVADELDSGRSVVQE